MCVSGDLKGVRAASAHLVKAVRVSELRIIGDFVLKGEADMYVTFFEGLQQQRPEQRHITGPLLAPVQQHTAKGTCYLSS